MQPGGTPQLLPIIAILGLIGWSVYRRTRAQKVRMAQTIVITALIVLTSIAGLVANTRPFEDPLFVVLAPVALLAGLGMGWMMMRTIRFWREGSTGEVWMSGGVAYVALWLATIALRMGIDYVATGGFSKLGQGAADRPPTTLSTVASDLLFLSIGLWLARGYALVRRYREYATVETGGEDKR